MRHPAPRPRTSQPLWVAAFTLAAASAAATATTVATPAPAGRSAALAIASETPLAQYRALRRMHALSEKADHEGWVDAWTEFDSTGFRYEIVAERGSGTVRNRVLKAMLQREQELVTNGDFGRGEVTPENYEFGEETERGGLKYVLIKPKRKDVMLIDGRLVLNPAGELLRIEGVLAKNPSFWTTRVNVIRHYAKVDGVRVPIATESIAKVRFVGQSRLNVQYEYETINNRQVRPSAPPSLGGLTPIGAMGGR